MESTVFKLLIRCFCVFELFSLGLIESSNYRLTPLIEVDKAKFINPASEQRTRGTHNFKYFIEHSNKDAHRFSFYPRTIREWNKLPWDVVNASSLSDFKAKLKQYLQD